MPELPEVETVKRSLQPLVTGEIIRDVEVFYGGIIKKPGPPEFKRLLIDRTIENVKRRGKYLLFQLSGGFSLVVHLRMTGQLTVCRTGVDVAKHTHLVFHFAGGREMRFTDARKFGLIYLIPTGAWEQIGGLAALGPEPLEEEFSLSYLEGLVKRKKGKVKAFLLDQTGIAGIGNIYADEIMFAAGLHPQRQVGSLSPEEVGRLYRAIRRKLSEGIEFRGTSVRDYVDGRGEKGGFQNRLQVYDRGGESCLRCGTRLLKETIAGRGTVFCPQCQQ